MNDDDVMCVQERMIHHIWKTVAENDQDQIDIINEYRASQGDEPISVKSLVCHSQELSIVMRLR